MRVRFLALELQRGCAAGRERSVQAGKRFWAQNTPESHTLIVLSLEPETIVFPSGEKPTEVMPELWALLFSVTSFSVAARGRASQLNEEMSGFGLNARLHPKL